MVAGIVALLVPAAYLEEVVGTAVDDDVAATVEVGASLDVRGG